MNDLHSIPRQGTFGGAIDKTNSNFSLVKAAIDEVEYATRKNKGLFPSPLALVSAIPYPKVGDWALVQQVGTGDSQSVTFGSTYNSVSLGFTIPQGATIYLSGDLSTLSGRTNEADATYLTITNGTIADRDIRYVKNLDTAGTVTVGYFVGSQSGDVFPCPIYVCNATGVWTNSGLTFSGDNVDLTDYATIASLDAHITNSVNAALSDINNTVYGRIVAESVTFTAAYDSEDLATAIPEGATIIGLTGLSSIVGRTANEETGQDLSVGSVTDRVVNHVKCRDTYTSVTITWQQLGLADRTEALETSLGQLAPIINGLTWTEELSYPSAWGTRETSQTIPQGSTINVSGASASGTLYGYTAQSDSDISNYQVITNGVVTDRDINYVRYNQTGTIILTIATGTIVNKLAQVNERIDDMNDVVDGESVSAQIRFTATYDGKQLPFTIPQGTPVYFTSDEITQLYCRTTRDESTYQICVNGTIADRDINWVKNQETLGTVIVKKYLTKGLVPRVADIENELASREENDALKNSIYEAARTLKATGLLQPLKILISGNSWSLNSTVYLGEVLQSLGIDVKIGVSYKGGGSLKHLWDNINTETADYEFHVWENGVWSRPTTPRTYQYIIDSERWDIITHQQVSRFSGVTFISTFQPYLHNILEWERNRMSQLPLFGLLATWAYPSQNGSPTFINEYDSDTDAMYADVMAAYNQALTDESLDFILPCAPTIQQARAAGIPDMDTVDADPEANGSHLSNNGFFVAAQTITEYLLKMYYRQGNVTKWSVDDSDFTISSLTAAQIATIKTIVKNVVGNITNYFPLASPLPTPIDWNGNEMADLLTWKTQISETVSGLVNSVYTDIQQAITAETAKTKELRTMLIDTMFANPAQNTQVEGTFLSRTTGGGITLANPIARFVGIKGNTLVWNQKQANGNFASVGGWRAIGSATITVDNNVATLLYSGTTTTALKYMYYIASERPSDLAGHKMYMAAEIKTDAISEVFFGTEAFRLNTSYRLFPSTSNWEKLSQIVEYPSATSSDTLIIADLRLSDYTPIYIKNVVCLDLTQMFGSGNEPTIEEFETMFPLDYYNYNSGELLNFNGTALKSVGFNLLNDNYILGEGIDPNSGEIVSSNSRFRSDYIKVTPNTSYYYYNSKTGVLANAIIFFDANKNYIDKQSAGYSSNNREFTTPTNCWYIGITNYATSNVETKLKSIDICINLSNASKNGTYVPYKEDTIALNIPTITGKLDGEGDSVTVFADGMKSAGVVYDEIYKENGVWKAAKRVGSHTLKVSYVMYNTANTGNVNTFVSAMGTISDADNTNVYENQCAKYAVANVNAVNMPDKSISRIGYRGNGNIVIKDSSYNSASELNASLSDSDVIYYRLATPLVYVLDDELQELLNVATGGTESILPENGSSPTTAPAKVKMIYREPLS